MMHILNIDLNKIDVNYDNTFIIEQGLNDVHLKYMVKNTQDYFYIYSHLVSLKEKRAILVNETFTISNNISKLELQQAVLSLYFNNVKKSKEILGHKDIYKEILELSYIFCSRELSKDLRELNIIILSDLIIYGEIFKNEITTSFIGINESYDFYEKETDDNSLFKDMIVNFMNNYDVEVELSKKTYLELLNYL